MFEVLTCSKPYTDTEDKESKKNNQHAFTIAVDNGMRPGPIPTKSDNATKLAVKCWHGNPLRRPTMKQVVDMIESIKLCR